MATPTTGVAVKWNNVEFVEVVDFKFALGGSLPISRESNAKASPFALDLGTIDIVCLGSANCAVSNYGVRATLKISGGGIDVEHKAIWEKVTVEAKTNDVSRYTVTLRLSPE